MSQQDDDNGSSDSACDYDSSEGGSDISTISSLSACYVPTLIFMLRMFKQMQ